ncbi:MAG TPA: multiheme c-type cytochrome [Candidatus Limnocylindrales bacterium]|nr:multiheme c-type cytochrome [Candidatus Limnocylindrales bacterium]
MAIRPKPGIVQPTLILAVLSFCLLPARSASTDTPEPSKYLGPGSCAATSCHGSVKPVAGSRIYQNEYSTWILQDKHSRAYGALTGDVGERMARILKLDNKAEEAPKCLACHALYTTPEQRGRPFEMADGVSCENCHGPASGWLGPHTTRDWPHEKSVAFGMHDTRNVIRRTEKCLECHLGTKNKFVDHEMIAAGHPDLYFELDSFSAVMPRHWKMPRESAPGKPAEDAAWAGVRDWSTGQAVQLRGEMERLVWRARNERFDKKDVWPEYSELSCFACHHSLGPAKDSWRQEHGYEGRRPGDPAWNASRYAVFRLLAKQIDSGSGQDLDKHLLAVSNEMSKLTPDRAAVANAASAAAPLAQQIAERLAGMQYDQAVTLRMMQRITDDAENIAIADERAAEQAAMAMDSLYIAYAKDTKPANDAEVRGAINALFQQLENPSSYNADQFASALRRIRPMLH